MSDLFTVFNRRQQEPGESCDTFVDDLRRLVRTCVESDRIILGIRDDATRKKLLQNLHLVPLHRLIACIFVP